MYCCEDIWHLRATGVKTHHVVYQLEPNVTYSQIEFILYLDRKPLYYMVNIIVPCCLLVIISLLVSQSASWYSLLLLKPITAIHWEHDDQNLG